MRIVRALFLFLALLPLVAAVNYHVYSTDVGFAGPAVIKPSGPSGINYLAFHVPTESLAELTCSGGGGRVQVVDAFRGAVLFNGTFAGSSSREFVVPREGTYWVVYHGNSATTCFVRFKRNDPTPAVQNAFYSIGIVGAVLYILYSWRGRR